MQTTESVRFPPCVLCPHWLRITFTCSVLIICIEAARKAQRGGADAQLVRAVHEREKREKLSSGAQELVIESRFPKRAAQSPGDRQLSRASAKKKKKKNALLRFREDDRAPSVAETSRAAAHVTVTPASLCFLRTSSTTTGQVLRCGDVGWSWERYRS